MKRFFKVSMVLAFILELCCYQASPLMAQRVMMGNKGVSGYLIEDRSLDPYFAAALSQGRECRYVDLEQLQKNGYWVDPGLAGRFSKFQVALCPKAGDSVLITSYGTFELSGTVCKGTFLGEVTINKQPEKYRAVLLISRNQSRWQSTGPVKFSWNNFFVQEVPKILSVTKSSNSVALEELLDQGVMSFSKGKLQVAISREKSGVLPDLKYDGVILVILEPEKPEQKKEEASSEAIKPVMIIDVSKGMTKGQKERVKKVIVTG